MVVIWDITVRFSADTFLGFEPTLNLKYIQMLNEGYFETEAEIEY